MTNRANARMLWFEGMWVEQMTRSSVPREKAAKLSLPTTRGAVASHRVVDSLAFYN
jgi:hypothetical protein